MADRRSIQRFLSGVAHAWLRAVAASGAPACATGLARRSTSAAPAPDPAGRSSPDWDQPAGWSR
jgi:hypothetical protein